MGFRESAIKLHLPGSGMRPSFLNSPLTQSLQILWQFRVEGAGWLVHLKEATTSDDIEKTWILPKVCDLSSCTLESQVDPLVKPASGSGARSEFYFIGLTQSLVKFIPANLIFKKVEVKDVLPAFWSEENQASLKIVMSFSF